MQLPDDVLLIIREYSKPVTRPDWRTLNPLDKHVLYNELHDGLFHRSIRLKPLFKRVFNHLCNSQWGEIYNYIRLSGIHKASLHFKRSVQDLYFMPSIKYAQNYYVTYRQFYHEAFTSTLS
jgi:hypothetical protein